VRVLIGSSQKMRTGTNVQKRLVALHHLDAFGSPPMSSSKLLKPKPGLFFR
jgi:hypothetical protein